MVEVMSCGGTSQEYGKRCRNMVPIKWEVEDWDESELDRVQKRSKLDSSQPVCSVSSSVSFLVLSVFSKTFLLVFLCLVAEKSASPIVFGFFFSFFIFVPI